MRQEEIERAVREEYVRLGTAAKETHAKEMERLRAATQAALAAKDDEIARRARGAEISDQEAREARTRLESAQSSLDTARGVEHGLRAAIREIVAAVRE